MAEKRGSWRAQRKTPGGREDGAQTAFRTWKQARQEHTGQVPAPRRMELPQAQAQTPEKVRRQSGGQAGGFGTGAARPGAGAFGGGAREEAGPLGALKRLGTLGVETVKDLAHDFEDRDENYLKKFARGDIGGGLANAVGTMVQSPQSLYLNTLAAAEDLAAGKRPEFQYRMDALDYLKASEERLGIEGEGNYSKLADMLNSERLSRRLLGNALALGANLGTDPLSYLDGAAALKGRWDRTPGTPTYGEAVSSGREAARLAEEARLIDEGWRDDEQPGMENTDKGVLDDPEYDDIIDRSIGAKRSSGSVLDPKTGRYYQLENYLQDQEVFAGYGVSTSLHEGVAEGLTEQFGGEVGRWQHVKGFTRLNMDGEEVMAEIHWFQEPSVGKVKLCIKDWWFE